MNSEKSIKVHPLAFLAVLLLVIVFALGSFRLVTGRSIGLRSFLGGKISSVVNMTKLLWFAPAIAGGSHGNFTNIIFLHHSTGNNLVQQGGVREIFAQTEFTFWDHGFNAQGLRGPDKKISKFNYRVPNDNTDPDGLARIFAQDVLPLPVNTLSALLQHEVIILKSCFEPANQLHSDSQLIMYEQYYLGMRDVMDKYPDHIFILLTTPPLNPAETNPEEARRARQYANWLKSEEFLAGHPNVFVFDFYDLLAEDDQNSPDANMLRAEYRDGSDSHPNMLANEKIGPVFASFVIEKIQAYRSLVASE